MPDNFERFRGRPLSNVFDLNYDKIHALSIVTLVLYLVFCIFIVNIIIISKKCFVFSSYYSSSFKKKCYAILYLLFF